MKAVQYRKFGGGPEVVDIPVPQPGPGQVLLRVLAAGVCHSDLAVMSFPESAVPFPLPLTLGHEGVGEVAALGEGATGVAVGERVAVYGPWGCGRCAVCAVGRENNCPHAGRLGIFPPGLGAPGALAEYLLVDSVRHLMPIGELDPVAAVPLTDAGLTPYSAVKRSLPKLVPGSTCVVIGAGGLGHMAVQLLRALTPARIVALDVSQEKLDLAAEVGAHEVVLSDGQAASCIRELTAEVGAEVVLDFVGAQATTETAAASAAMAGDISVVGMGGGALPVGFGRLPYNVSVTQPYWGSRSELAELLALARAGAVHAHVETYSLDRAPEVYERLSKGGVSGRAVLVPNG
ncbi:NAD(P)-dependent alcohol dehydrogenase [Streptomyces sp. NPDC048527]|uniref:NAD(P)-dependent alcohol dehydrogenase n=1 Tax=Streptomyces sp. NPDC048527 TaxID=3365568 RepID=UPI003723509A